MHEALKQKFEGLFRTTEEEGKKRIVRLVEQAMKMARNTSGMAEDVKKVFGPGAEFDGSYTRLSDRDFLMLSFFGLIGAGLTDRLADELGIPKAIAAETDEEESRRWFVSASVPKGNGKRDTEKTTIEGTRADAEEALWSILETLGVETAIEMAFGDGKAIDV